MKKLYIKQKVFSIGEKFTVMDEQQKPRYFVEGSFMKIPKSFAIYDERQQQIGEVTKKVFSLLPKFFVEVHGEEAIVLEKNSRFSKRVIPSMPKELKFRGIGGTWTLSSIDRDVKLLRFINDGSHGGYL